MPCKIYYFTIYRKNMLIPALKTYNPQEQGFCKCSINIWKINNKQIEGHGSAQSSNKGSECDIQMSVILQK